MTSPGESPLGVLARLQASGAARRLYPVPVGVALARVRAQRLWGRPAARRDALANMDLLVGRTPRAAELEDLARRFLFETCKHQELVWRLDVVTRMPVDGLDRLRTSLDRGRGAILSVVHQGHFGAHPACISRHGFPMRALVAPTLLGEQPATFAGVHRRQLAETFAGGRDVTVVNAAGSYAQVRSFLQAGGTVLLGCDLKGSTPVRFLGRTVGVPSGTARLSLDTGAPVLPVSVAPDGHLERLEVQEPLLPEDHRSPTELLQAVFDRHAPAALAWPQGFERPLLHFEQMADEPTPT